jgi:Putative phage serine protease XkdF
MTTAYAQVKRSDDLKKIVYAEVYAPSRIDAQNEFMVAEDIETMAHRFMGLKLDETIDVRHNGIAICAHPVESFIARKGDPDYTDGAWVLGIKIDDDSVWEEIKNGKLNGFSFQSLVKHHDVEVDVVLIRDHSGLTEKTDGHDHIYFVSLDDNGNIVAGGTSKAEDGHYHRILKGSRTAETDGHSHRFFI